MKNLNLSAKSLDELDPGFCSWLAGLVDGEGSFSLKHAARQWWTEGTIKLRDDDRPMLEMIRKELGRGRCYQQREKNPQLPNVRPQYILRFHTAADTRFIVALFERYPLRSKKKREFEIWAEARKELDKPIWARDLRHLRYLYLAIRDTRRYEQPVLAPYKPEGNQMALAMQGEK